MQDVEAANIPSDLRAVALWKAIDLRSGTGGPPTPGLGTTTAGAGASLARPSPVAGDHATASGDSLASIAHRLGVDRATVEEVFTLQGGELELIVPVGKLPSKVAAATKEIALLIAGGRQAAAIEEWTSWDAIRAVCVDYKRIDTTNFAKTIREMDDVFNFRKDSERKLSVKVARPGWDRLAEAIRRIGGE